jgi:hypothetical protein
MQPRALTGALLLAAAWTGTVSAQEAPATADAAVQAPTDTMAIGRRATEFFYDAEIDSLWAMLTPAFQESLGSPDKLLERLDFLSDRAGAEVEVIEESIRMRNGRPQYWRVAEFDLAPEPLLLRWVISPEGKVSGQGIGLASQPPQTDD